MYDLHQLERIVLVLILISIPVVSVRIGILYSIPQYVLSTILWSTALVVLVTYLVGESYLFKNTQQRFSTNTSLILFIMIVNIVLWYFYGVLTKYGLNTIVLDRTWYLIQIVYYTVFTMLVEAMRKFIVLKISTMSNLLKIMFCSTIATFIQIIVQNIVSLNISLLFNTILLFEINLVLTLIAILFDYREQVLIALTYVYLYKLSPILPVLDMSVEHMFKEIMILITVTIIYAYSLKTSISTSYYYGEPVVEINSLRSKISKFINTILTILLALTLVLFIMGFRGLTVVTNSMYPVINRGDLVIVNTIDKNIDRNNIIAFKVSDKVVIHRVVDKTTVNGEIVYITKGDANSNKDPWLLRESNIIGKAVLTIPYFGLPAIYYTFLVPDKVLSIGFITIFISLFMIIYLIHKIVLIKYE